MSDPTNPSAAGFPADESIPAATSADPERSRYALAPKPLAAGGMGEVYLARDMLLNRRLAVKVLKARLVPHAESVQRFHREAVITAQLQHPGIPPVHDHGTLADGRPFMAMKLIQGQTLEAELNTRKSLDENLPRFLQMFSSICQAVAYAHSRGIVHRDIKPSNVMVGAFHEVQVMDWGIAKLLAGEGHEALLEENPATTMGADPLETGGGVGSNTQTGTAFGTPAYMPPEQARGELHRIAPWSDSFALGGILGVILTGRAAYTGTTRIEIVRKAQAGNVTEAYARLDASGAPSELIELAKRCLAPKPEDRPPDGTAVATAIDAYRDSVEKRMRAAETDRAAQEARAEEAVRRAEAEQERAEAEQERAEEATRRILAERANAEEQRKRRRVQMALAGSIALLLIGGIAFAWWSDHQSSKRAAADAARKADDERAAAARREDDERATAAAKDRESRNSTALQTALDRGVAALQADNTALAEAAVVEAEKRAAENATAEQKSALARLKEETATLRALDKILDKEWTVARDRLTDNEDLVKDFAVAFRQFGIVPGSGSPAEQAKRIQASRIRDRLLAGLDRWLRLGRTAALLPLLHAADPDRYRNEVRTAVANADVLRIRVLGDDPAALLQPPHFGTMQGSLPDLKKARRESILLAAHRRKPGDFLLLMTLASLYDGRTEFLSWRQIRFYTAALVLRPDSIAAWNNLGNALLNVDEPEQAVDALRIAVRLDPDLPNSHYNLGIALDKLGDTDAAMNEYRIEIKLDPDNAYGYVNLASHLSDRGNVKAAIALNRQAMKVHPRDPIPYHNLALELLQFKEFEEALELARKSVSLDPKNPKAFRTLGVVQATNDDYPAAKRSFERAIELAPKAPEGHLGMGNVLEKLGDLDGATAKFNEALALDPKFQPALNGLERVKKKKAEKK